MGNLLGSCPCISTLYSQFNGHSSMSRTGSICGWPSCTTCSPPSKRILYVWWRIYRCTRRLVSPRTLGASKAFHQHCKSTRRRTHPRRVLPRCFLLDLTRLVADSGLIYFAQNGSYLGPITGTSPAAVTSAVGFNENATLPFVPGKTYRLRIINMSALSAFFFWIDGHSMRLIEVDGVRHLICLYKLSEDWHTFDVCRQISSKVQPIWSPSLLLSDIRCLSRRATIRQQIGPFTPTWTQVCLIKSRLTYKSVCKSHCLHLSVFYWGIRYADITSSITYNLSAPITNLGFINQYHDIADFSLVPVVKEAQPVVTRTIELEVLFATMDDGTNRAMFNEITYNSPLVPAVFSALSLGSNATVPQAYGPSSFVLDPFDVVDLVIKNGDVGKHPL